MKRKLLKLTGIGEMLTEEAQQRAEKIEPTTFQDIECENGRTREEYENLGIRVPKDLIAKEKAFNAEDMFEDEDYEQVASPCTLFLDELVGYVASSEGDTVIFTREKYTFNVLETVQEIDMQIEYLQMSFLQKLQLKITLLLEKWKVKKMT